MFPIAIMKFYLSVTVFLNKSNDEINYETFAYQITIVISYINSRGMFFIYTLRRKLFRDELIRLFFSFEFLSSKSRTSTCRNSSDRTFLNKLVNLEYIT